MILQIKRWLAPPVFPDDEPKTRHAILLNFALLTCMVLGLCLIAGNLAGGTVPAVLTGLDIGSIAVCLALRHWVYKGRVRLASGALLTVGLVGITTAVVFLGTIRTPTTAFYMLLVIFAGLLFDLGGMITMTGLCSLAIAGLIVAENTGLLPRPDYAVTISQWATYTVLFAWVGSLTLSSLQSTRRALAHAENEITERKQAEEALHHSQKETAHANRLLLALSQAAQAVQHARKTEEVYSAIEDQVTQMGYSVAGFNLSEDSQNLVVAYNNYKPELVRKGEKMTGLSLRDFRFRPRVDSIYHRIIAKGETVFVKIASQAITDTLPKSLRALARPITDLFKFDQSIFAPLKVGDQTIGILIVTGSDLTEIDNPAITAFANQAAIAMQNARLYEQAQQEITERKKAEQELHLLSDTQRQIAQQKTLADIFQLVGKKIRELIGDGYVAITILDEQEQAMKVIGLYGFGNLPESLVRRLKVDPSRMVFDLKDMNADELRLFRSGKLEKFEKGLYALSSRKVPERVCVAAERTLKLTGAYTMGFVLHDLHYGGLTILAKNDITSHKGMIENIMNQATAAMQRIKAETSLQTSEEQLRLITDNMLDMVIRTDLLGTILYASPSHQTILGYKPEHPIGKSIFDLMHPEDIDRVRGFALEALQTQTPGKQEFRYRHADGHYLWMESAGAIIFDDKGSPAEAVFSSRDITERKQADEALHKSEAELKEAQRIGQIGSWEWDTTKDTITWTEEYYRIYGVDPRQRPFGYEEHLKGYTPESAERLVNAVMQSVQSGAGYQLDLELARVGGTRRWITARGEVKRDASGQNVGLRGTAQDITERMQAEEALEESESKYRSLIETAGAGVATIDIEGKVVFVNQAICKLTGYSKEELIGKPFAFFLHPDDTGKMLEIFQSASEQPSGSLQVEFRGVHRDGHTVHCYSNPTILWYQDRIIGFNAIIFDISERKRAEERIHVLSSRQEAILASIPDIIMEVDNNKVYSWASHAGYEFFGGDVIGKEAAFYFEGEQNTYGVVEPLFKGNDDVFYVESWQRRKDGEKRLLAWWCQVLKDEKGNITGALSSAHDITERKQAETALRESEERFRSILENIVDGYFEVDTAGNLTFFNSALYRMLGRPADELMGMNNRMYMNPEGAKAVFQTFNRVFRTEIPEQASDWELVRPDGSRRSVEASVSVIKAANGSINGFRGIVRDITERKRAEKLQDAIYRIAQAADQAESPDALFPAIHGIIQEVMAADNFYIALYDGKNDLLSFPYSIDEDDSQLPTKKPGKGLTEYVLRTGKAVLCDEALYEDLIQRGEIELVGAHSPIWVGVPLIAEGKMIGVMAVQDYKNIRAYGERELHMLEYVSSQVAMLIHRKLAQEKLAASEAELRALFAGMTDVVIVYDTDGRYVKIAPTNPKGLYRPAEEMLGKTMHEILPKEQADYIFARVRKSIQSGQVITGDYTLQIGGEEIWRSATFSPLSETTAILVSHDITERKQAEEELEKSHEQLRALTTYWQTSFEAERTHIAREIHDEFGQSMTALKMDLTWLAKRLPEEDDKVERIRGMTTLVDDSIALMRRIATDLRPGLLDDLGLNAAMEWQAQEFSRRSGIPCKLNLPKDDLALDPALSTTLFRIFQETLTNIARHAQATRVSASLKPEDQNLVLTMRDNGRGITEGELNNPRSLGLLSLRERAAQWRGETTIRGKAGKGTTVTIRIPLPASAAKGGQR